ncbi:hypothetical protein L9F63_001712 [Diploptera punctata]|uniref:Ketimine reductase mu-crystallin n=1 Tax=Diploptera punctata TaxID=6984 RepID=A0AAD8EIU6_DIPPU|nr:hypothetical protein L9F63_001712 [Diploptera punctata]
MASVSMCNEVIQPPRMFMRIPSKNGVLLTMPAFSESENAMACKLVTAYPRNVEKGLSSIIATVLLFDPDTGKVSAIMDGNEITTWRTAAASVVATKYLNNQTKTLAILGAGTQARSHAEALDLFFNFTQIRIWNHRYERAQKLASNLEKEGKSVVTCRNAEECVQDADVIVTATFSSSPILKKDWIKPGAHINAIGAGISHHSELEMELYEIAVIYTDDMSSAKYELKGLLDAGISIFGEIGEVINGSKSAECNKITIFQSLGMAVEDLVSAKLIYEEYKKMKK